MGSEGKWEYRMVIKGNFFKARKKIARIRHQLNQIIKVNITSSGTNWHNVPSDMVHQGHNVTCVVFLPNTHNSNLSRRNYQKNPNWGTIYKITGLYSSKVAKPWKTKGRLSKCPGLKETRDRTTNHGILDWILNQK